MELNQLSRRQFRALKEAFAILARAAELAADLDRDPWDLAVEISHLRDCGLDDSELRWLVCKGFAISANDLTDFDQPGRRFGAQGILKFLQNTCFVLTPQGADARLQLAECDRDSLLGVASTLETERADRGPERPVWEPDLRVLRVGDRIVKHFRVPAEIQELILNTFEEDDWARRIDDPLPPSVSQTPKQRLQSAIMCLNRNQRRRLIRFRGDGSGTGITWEFARTTEGVSGLA